MPQQEHRVHNFYNILTPSSLMYVCRQNCDDDMYKPNIGNAISYSLEDTDYLGDQFLDSSVADTFMKDHTDEWQKKSVGNWTPEDIVHWINSEARALNVCCTELAGEKFAEYNGLELLLLAKSKFLEIDTNYGAILYQRLHDIVESSNTPLYTQLNSGSCMKYESEDSIDERIRINHKIHLKIEQEEQNELVSPSSPPVPKKKGPGRPKGSKRKKKPEKLGRLWEFLRDLLKNREYCPSLIVWDNYEEGMFRFVHSDKVAKLWGSKKDNPEMNYEKLSRAMRYYYKSKVLQPVIGRRLVYKFGPKATGWRVDNPNFKD